MIHVAAPAAGGGIPLQREGHAVAQFLVGLVDGRCGRDSPVIGRADQQARHAKIGGDLIQVSTSGVGQHDAARRLVDPLTDEQFAVRGHLQDLVGGISLSERGERAVTPPQVREHLSQDRFEVERLDHIGRCQPRQIDLREGIGDHRRTSIPSRRIGRPSGRYVPRMSSVMEPGAARLAVTRSTTMRLSQR